MRQTALVVGLLLLVSCAPQPAIVVVTATPPPLTVIGTPTSFPTDAAAPYSSRTIAPTETRTSQPARANPECFHGPGQWLESSLNDQPLTGNLVLELMYRSDSNAICTNVDGNWTYQAGIQGYPYFAHLSTRDSIRCEDRVVLVASLTSSRRPDRFVAITARTCQYYGSHVDGARLFGTIFTREGDKWQTVVPTHYITEFGSWGEFQDLPENKELVWVGPDMYGIILKNTDGNQGVIGTVMIIIAELDGQLRTILEPQTIAGDGSDFCMSDTFPQCWHYDSEIQFVPGDSPEYLDLQITTRGTDYDSDHFGQIKDASRVRLFKFKNGQYVSTDSKDHPPSSTD